MEVKTIETKTVKISFFAHLEFETSEFGVTAGSVSSQASIAFGVRVLRAHCVA